MHKAVKVLLILAVVMILLGSALCIGGFAAVGFDFAKFHGIEGEYTEISEDVDGNGITTLMLEDLSGPHLSYNVRLIPSKDQDFHLTYGAYDGTLDDELYWTADNGTLRISAETFSWKDHIEFFSFGFDLLPLVIEVPASVDNVHFDIDAAEFRCEDLTLNGDLFCDSDAARVDLQNMAVKGNISLDSDTAEVILEHINAGSLDVNCDLGSVTMKDIDVGNVLIDADTCDIDFTSLFSEGRIEIDADLGSIDLESVSAQMMSVSADTCDVNISSLLVEKSIAFDLSLSDLSGTLDDAQSSYTIFTRIDAGSCNLSSGGSGFKTLDISVDVGDVEIAFLK